MPCDSAYLNHSDEEAESGRVLEFLKEIHGQPFDHENPSYYGNVATLNEDTALLCAFLSGLYGLAVKDYSLELQLWWKRHQKHDAEREAEQERRWETERLAVEARAKLTPAERKALGIK